MCKGWPCSCCRPVKKIDTHFDGERPWKCLFRDMVPIRPATLPDGMTIATANLIGLNDITWWFTSGYQLPGARRLEGPCALSKYQMPTLVPPGQTVAQNNRCMARMKYDYGETWTEQVIHVSFDYEFLTDPATNLSGSSPPEYPSNRIQIIIGDEQDDPGETYLYPSLSAYPNLWIYLNGNWGRNNTVLLQARTGSGTLILSGNGRKLSDNSFFPLITQSGTFEVTVELLAASTRVAAKYNGEDIGWTTTFPAREQWRSGAGKVFRESPRFRVGVEGRQVFTPYNSPATGVPIDSFKIDRLRASAVAL